MLKPMTVRLAAKISPAGRLGRGPRSVAVGNHPAIGRDAAQALFQHWAADAFQNQLHAVAAGLLVDDFLEILLGIVDALVRSQRAAEVQLVLCRSGDNDTGAPSLSKLNSHRSHTRGPGLNQHRMARLQLPAGLQQMVGSQEHDGHTAGLHRVNGFGVGKDEVTVDRHQSRLARRAPSP